MRCGDALSIDQLGASRPVGWRSRGRWTCVNHCTMCNEVQQALLCVLAVYSALCNNRCMTVDRAVGTIPQLTRGDRMRMSLRHAGVGVQEMATYLDVARNTVSTWLNDRIVPSKQTMRLWAMRCGVPLVWLETGEAPTDSPSGPRLYTTRDSNPEPADYESAEREPAGRVLRMPTRQHTVVPNEERLAS